MGGTGGGWVKPLPATLCRPGSSPELCGASCLRSWRGSILGGLGGEEGGGSHLHLPEASPGSRLLGVCLAEQSVSYLATALQEVVTPSRVPGALRAGRSCFGASPGRLHPWKAHSRSWAAPGVMGASLQGGRRGWKLRGRGRPGHMVGGADALRLDGVRWSGGLRRALARASRRRPAGASAGSGCLRPGTCWGVLKEGPWFCSHRRFPLSVNFLLLPLHLAETVEATEASESELGHALGQAGGLLTREDLRGEAEEEGGQEEGRREKQAGLTSWSPLQVWRVPATPRGCPRGQTCAGGRGCAAKQQPL